GQHAAWYPAWPGLAGPVGRPRRPRGLGAALGGASLGHGWVPAWAAALGVLLRRPAHAGDGRHPGDPAAAHHLPHHLLALEEPDHEVVDLAHGDPGPVRDP